MNNLANITHTTPGQVNTEFQQLIKINSELVELIKSSNQDIKLLFVQMVAVILSEKL